MQIFGGYGVVKDYDVERFLRDSLILPIYEGTSQIQSLMATKDLLKAVMRNPRVAAGAWRTQPCAGRRALRAASLGRAYRQALSKLQCRAGLADGRRRSPGRSASRGAVDARQRRPRRGRSGLRAAVGRTADAHAGLPARGSTAGPASRSAGPSDVRWPNGSCERTSDVCALDARRIMRGDRDALEAIEAWHAATA